MQGKGKGNTPVVVIYTEESSDTNGVYDTHLTSSDNLGDSHDSQDSISNLRMIIYYRHDKQRDARNLAIIFLEFYSYPSSFSSNPSSSVDSASSSTISESSYPVNLPTKGRGIEDYPRREEIVHIQCGVKTFNNVRHSQVPQIRGLHQAPWFIYSYFSLEVLLCMY